MKVEKSTMATLMKKSSMASMSRLSFRAFTTSTSLLYLQAVAGRQDQQTGSDRQ